MKTVFQSTVYTGEFAYPDRVERAEFVSDVVLEGRFLEVVERTRPAQTFLFTQGSPETEWVVNHNLGFRPQVEVRSTGGTVVIAEVVHFNTNQLRIYFAAPFAGEARLI